jgi:hypothetical protein
MALHGFPVVVRAAAPVPNEILAMRTRKEGQAIQFSSYPTSYAAPTLVISLGRATTVAAERENPGDIFRREKIEVD